MRKIVKENYWIEGLVGLGGIIEDQDKANILLVWKGFKPATMVELSCSERTAFSQTEFQKKVGDLRKILRVAKLKYRIRLNYPKDQKEITRFSFIAKKRKVLEKLVATDTLKNIKERRLKVGVLLGYPITAVRAFANGTALSEKNFSLEMSRRNELKFLDFRLSQHWRRELRYVRKKADLLEKIAPVLYKKIASQNPKH